MRAILRGLSCTKDTGLGRHRLPEDGFLPAKLTCEPGLCWALTRTFATPVVRARSTEPHGATLRTDYNRYHSPRPSNEYGLGAFWGHGSGDIVLCFTTADPVTHEASPCGAEMPRQQPHQSAVSRRPGGDAGSRLERALRRIIYIGAQSACIAVPNIVKSNSLATVRLKSGPS